MDYQYILRMNADAFDSVWLQIICNGKAEDNISRLIVIIMSHGEKDAVCDNNGNHVPIQDIIHEISPPSIDGVPKVSHNH